MTDPMTTTRDGDVLNTDGLANIEHTLDTHVKYHAKVDTEWARMVAMQVIQSHRALTEQVRVLRECVEWYADPTNYRDEDVAAYGYRARRALAALEGSGE